jgi:anti-sigma regulatory factor (Ser/Thr protein kinase)
VSPSKSFPPEPSSAQAARQFIRSFLDQRCPETVVDCAVLLTSELVTNAVLHARSPVAVDVSNPDRSIRVAVTDSSRVVPQVTRSKLTEHGRGLPIVIALSDQWGSEVTFNGKTTWFSLHLPGDEA